MDVAALRIFVAVARHGSFSAVARAQGVEPSSVSRIIAGIEQELGERLLQRSTRKLTLTEAGQLYLARIEPLLEQIEEATAEIRALGRGPVGTVRLSTSVAFGLACVVPLLGAFRAAFPDLTLELIMSDVTLDLVGEGVDLAVRLAPSVEANVVTSKLFDTRYHVVAAPDWLRAHPLGTPTDLAVCPVLRFTFPGFRDRWLFRDATGAVVAVPVRGPMLFSSPLALRAAAIAALGPALLPDWLVRDDVLGGTLVDCFPTHRATATEFSTCAWLIYPTKAFLPTKVRVTVDFLRQHLAV